jgi:hypothetical protein
MDKPKLAIRRCEGLQVHAGGKSFPHAYALYSELYTDGTEKFVRGHSIHSVMSSACLNGTRKEKDFYLEATRPDLFAMIEAAAVLNRSILDECQRLDNKRGCGETK